MEKLSAYAVEILELLALLLGAGVASFVGISIERFGIAAVMGGDLVVGLWAVGMGMVVLYVGIVALGVERVLPRVRALVDGA